MNNAGPCTHIFHGSATMVYSELDGPQGADGWTFVLVHGIGMGRAVFADLAVALAAHGRVFIDLPGFGDSPQPEQRLTMPQAGDLLAEWMKDVLPGARETNGRGARTTAASSSSDIQWEPKWSPKRWCGTRASRMWLS